MPNDDLKPLEKPVYHKRQDTVADIHLTDDGHVHVLLHGHPQVLSIHSTSKSKNELLARLAHAKKNNHSVHVNSHTHTGHISHVKETTAEERHEYAKRPIFKHPDEGQKIVLGNIDPTTFNLVGSYLKARAFARNQDIVKSYGEAKKMFDYCVKQSCETAKKTTFTPPIPFQYLQNGCFARAHKMRQIMLKRFGFSCLKAFCFARKSTNYLSVRAEMWGGCCIPPFWFHVAPLIRVRVDSKTVVAMIFDPSVCTRPLLMSTWMTGLVNKSCYDLAHMTDFSIQPGDAYGPMGDGVWLADPDYIYTDETLTKFAKLESCPKKSKSNKPGKAATKKSKSGAAKTSKKTAGKKIAVTNKSVTKKKPAAKKAVKVVKKKKAVAKKKAVTKKKR